ncbi:MAG: NUDIX hydrolase [Gammaproteobacteria bacterium]|nr:NUDIX hydrolase [Gammaproteobacteria bacterium]MCF6231185.1 NUDIX hydrolase [Gammaproteobacteria bacterium]
MNMRPTTPLITVDLVIELTDRADSPIVLIERKYPPYGWALPGGFVDVGEALEQAAIREAKEETSLDVTLKRLLGCYSHPSRDERGHTVSAVYIATAVGEPCAEDDAAGVEIFSVDALPKRMAFDHALIMADYKKCRLSECVTPLRV